MTFISYAQNYEDVLLWRALKEIPNGFYIDVGANDPEEDSVTKAFYDRGWQGINIEPLPAHLQRLNSERPRDINLAIAAGARNGEITLYDIPAVRGWASPSEPVAQMHQENGLEVTSMTVPVRTLADICAEHVRQEIHFLKVDVEGFEGEVIRGMDFEQWRPWVVVVEATLPNSQVTNHELWENMLTDSGYRYVYFDGLNRYYVADEHRHLARFFQTPPNVFDDFQKVAQRRAEDAERAAVERAAEAERIAAERVEEAERKVRILSERAGDLEQSVAKAIHEAEQKTKQAREEGLAARRDAQQYAQEAQEAQAQLQAQLHSAHAQLAAMYSSNSWRVTAPLRFATSAIGSAARYTQRELLPAAKRTAAAAIRRAYPYIKRNEFLTKHGRRFAARFPSLGARLLAVLHARPVPAGPLSPDVPAPPAQDAPAAWTEGVTLKSRFAEALLKELEQRKDRHR